MTKKIQNPLPFPAHGPCLCTRRSNDGILARSTGIPFQTDSGVRPVTRGDSRELPALAIPRRVTTPLLVSVVLCVATAVTGCRQPTTADVAAKPWMDALENVRPEVRAEAIVKLAAMKYRPAAGRIAKRVNDIRPDVRLDAIRALGELGDPVAVPALRQALSETEWLHRKEAVASLGKIRDKSAIPILAWALADSDQAVGRASAVALACLGPASEDKLLEVLRAGPMAARPNAATALGLMKSARAREPLRAALTVSNASLRVSAMIALAAFSERQDMDALSVLLGDGDPSVSRAAADVLSRNGVPAVPALLAATTNLNRQVRLNAYRVLLDHPGETGVMPALLAGWDDRDRAISSLIQDRFTTHGLPRPEFVAGLKTQLIQALGNPSDGVRMHALELVEPVLTGDDVDAVAVLLADRNDALKRRAAGVLSGIRDERSRQALRQLATSPSDELRYVATTALASQGDEESVTRLIALLEGALSPSSTESTNRDFTVFKNGPTAAHVDAAVVAIGLSRDKRAVPVVSRMLSTTHPTMFLRVCRALAEMRTPDAFEPLARAADNANWRFREGRSAALQGLGWADPKRAVAEYAKHLNSTNVYQENYHREIMLEQLGKIADERGIPPLAGHLVHDNEEVRRAATRALIDMKGAAVNGLLAEAATTNRTLRSAIAFCLAQIGAPALPATVASTRASDAHIREVAAWAVGQMDDPAEGVAAVRQRLGMDTSSDVRAACAWAIGRAKSADDASINALIEVLRGDSATACRHTAAFALGEIASPAAVPALTHALADPESTVRAVAAGALGRIGISEAIAPLRNTATGDKSPEVRATARNALIAMGQTADDGQEGTAK